MPIANLRSLAVQRTPLRELNLNMLLGGPVLALPCQEAAGNFLDISGFGNNGVPTNITRTILPSGLQVLGFNGANSHIDCGNAPSLNFTTSDFTIELGVYFDDLDGVQVLFSRGIHLTDGYYFDMRGTGQLYVSTDTLGVNTSSTYILNLTAGAWFYIVVRKQGTSITVYKNTVAYTSAVVFQNPASSVRTAKIGVYGTGASNFLDGLAGLVRATPRALNVPEIQNRYDRIKHYFDVFDGNILARLLQQRQLAVLR